LYFVFEDVAMVVGSCGSYNIPQVFWGIPHNFAPTHIDMVELNWIVLCWSCRDIDKIPCASSDGSPPRFFEVNKGYVAIPSFFYSVGCKSPAFSGCKVHHNEELDLDVTLPLNISLDLGLGIAHNTQLSKQRYTWTLIVM